MVISFLHFIYYLYMKTNFRGIALTSSRESTTKVVFTSMIYRRSFVTEFKEDKMN